jgi:catechol 2,3-dioxygenase-like lactoylglutathione lyase family enzyme
MRLRLLRNRADCGFIGSMATEALRVEQVVPILRIFDVAKAKEFYCDYLGFRIDWEHRFADDLPLYMQVSLGRLLLHLSEHHGDGTPGSMVFVRVRGLRDFHARLAKNYRYLRPGLEQTERGSLCVELLDPFGNRLRLDDAAG